MTNKKEEEYIEDAEDRIDKALLGMINYLVDLDDLSWNEDDHMALCTETLHTYYLPLYYSILDLKEFKRKNKNDQ